MARLRYLSDPAASAPAAKKPGAAKITHTVQSIRVRYETEPEIHRALVPKPLVPSERPEMFIQFANVAMHLSPEKTLQIGAATVGVKCSYEGREGHYVLAMPMPGEFVVIGGREKYGEPKKIANTSFSLEDGKLNAQVERHGVTFLELGGRLGDELPDAPREFTEHFYCHKAMPTCEPEKNENGGFDGDVLLMQLNWERNYTSVKQVHDPEIILRDSAHDPLIDVPVLRILDMQFAEGASKTGGEVLRAIPGEWFAPFVGQRYDTPQVGVEIPLASEAEVKSA